MDDKRELESQLVEIEKEMESLEAQRELLLYILNKVNADIKVSA